MDIYEKKGYLNDNFKIFHLSDSGKREFEFHYHDFYKILLFLNGNVNYSIEGKTYHLAPFDVVLVGAGEIHRPIVEDERDYERIIIYISPELFNGFEEDLRFCFKRARELDSNVLRLPAIFSDSLKNICLEMKRALEEKEFASTLLANIKLTELLIMLNRVALNKSAQYIPKIDNSKIREITLFINENLKEELTVDLIAQRFFLSRYHLMHIFKAGTGCTVYSYITQKRLLLARNLINEGKSVTEACFDSGFKNYDSFLRAYKNSFGTTPKKK